MQLIGWFYLINVNQEEKVLGLQIHSSFYISINKIIHWSAIAMTSSLMCVKIDHLAKLHSIRTQRNLIRANQVKEMILF